MAARGGQITHQAIADPGFRLAGDDLAHVCLGLVEFASAHLDLGQQGLRRREIRAFGQGLVQAVGRSCQVTGRRLKQGDLQQYRRVAGGLGGGSAQVGSCGRGVAVGQADACRGEQDGQCLRGLAGQALGSQLGRGGVVVSQLELDQGQIRLQVVRPAVIDRLLQPALGFGWLASPL